METLFPPTSSVYGPGCDDGWRGSVRHQLSEVKSPPESPGRNPVVDPDAMIFQEGSSEGVASSFTQGLVPDTLGNIIRVDPSESGVPRNLLLSGHNLSLSPWILWTAVGKSILV